MKFRKTIIGAILAAVISVTAISPCSVVYADTSKTASAENDIPTNFKAKKTATSITLNWDVVDGADAYKVYMLNSATGKYEKYKIVTKTSCKITGLSKGTKYYFKVSVMTKNGEKYKEKANSMSKRVSVTTEKSLGKNYNIKTFYNIKIGSSEKDVLKKLGITNYKKTKIDYLDVEMLDKDNEGDWIDVSDKYYRIETEIEFTWKNSDYNAILCLDFDNDKTLLSWTLEVLIPSSAAYDIDDVKDDMEKDFRDVFITDDYKYASWPGEYSVSGGFQDAKRENFIEMTKFRRLDKDGNPESEWFGIRRSRYWFVYEYTG